MRRADVLRLAELSVGQFDALIARGLIPFTTPHRRGGWGDFTAEQAFRIGLFNALSGAGMPQARAAICVRADYGVLSAYGEASAREDRWFGSFSTVSKIAGEPSAKLHYVFATTLKNLRRDVSQKLEQAKDHEPPTDMVLINATDVMRRMLANAAEHQIVDEDLVALAVRLGAS